MTDLHEATSGSPTPTLTINEPAATPPEILAKGKNRKRLLRGLQRISSSQSLNGLRRSKSVGSPYGGRARSSLSCVSLAAVGPPQGLPSASTNPLPSPSSLGHATASSVNAPTTPGEFPFFESIDEHSAARLVETGAALTSAPTSVRLPPGVSRSPRLDGPCCVGATSRTSSRFSRFWEKMPQELRIHIFSFLGPRELVRASRVSKTFYQICFDGQLWAFLDASEFYQDIPAESLARIISHAGPFVKNLNLRGCVQVEHYKRTEVIVKACKNLLHATLQDCRNMHKNMLHTLLRNNGKLVHLNLTGLAAVSNASCKIIADSCPQLEMLDVSWCEKVEARGLKTIIEHCPSLKDLRAGEVRGFDSTATAEAIFETNHLERLVLRGCVELTDEALKTMVHGKDPQLDVLTDIPLVPARKWRHLDLSRCARLSDGGVKSLAHLTPVLEGLQLSGCKSLSNAALEPILATSPRLTHLDLEDMGELTNSILSEHLAKAPCASQLEHLSLSYCENIGDAGLLPVLQRCTRLKTMDLDNTRISDLALAEAAYMVNRRSKRSTKAGGRPRVGLKMTVYDCQNVTWTGVREVLFRNAQILAVGGGTGDVTYPVEMIALKCFYGFQMTVDEHQKRVLRGEFEAAGRLERKWADYMQANEEAGVAGAGYRRRRRRAREAQALHAHEEDGPNGRRRARTTGSCAVM